MAQGKIFQDLFLKWLHMDCLNIKNIRKMKEYYLNVHYFDILMMLIPVTSMLLGIIIWDVAPPMSDNFRLPSD